MSFPYMVVTDRGADSVSVIDLSKPGTPVKAGEDIPVGVGPRAVAMSSAHVAYVVNEGRDGTVAGTVSVIDARDPKAVKRVEPDVTVGLRPRAVALSAAADHAYVANRGADTVSLLDIKSDPLKPTKVGDDIPVGTQPSALVVDTVSGRTFVANWGAGTVTALSRPDVKGTVTTTGITVGDRPRAFAVHPTAGVVYVANWGSGTVSVIQAAKDSGQPAATITVGSQPRALAVSPVGDLLCVANYGSDTVTAVPLSQTTGLLTGGTTTIPVGRNPAAVAFAPGGSFACTANHTAGSISIIDPSAMTARQVLAGIAPIAVTLAADGSYAWVTDHVGGALVAVYCGGPKVVARKPVDTSPVTVAAAPGGGGHLLVTDDASGKVTPLSLSGSTLTVGTPLALGDGARPWGVAYAPDGALAYVTDFGTDGVRVLDADATTVKKTVPLATGAAPRGVAVTPDGRYVCTADSGGNTLSLIWTGAEPPPFNDSAYGFTTPRGLAIAPLDGRSVLYVSNLGSETVSVLELDATGSTVQRHSLIDKATGRFDHPHGIAVTSDRSTMYVANYTNKTISVLDGQTGSWTFRRWFNQQDTGYKQHGICLSEDEKLLYVANAYNNAVTVFETATGTPHVINDAGYGFAVPKGVAVHGGILYVANITTISILLLKSDGYEVDSFKDPHPVTGAQDLVGLSVSEDGRTLYATDRKAQQVFALTLDASRCKVEKQSNIDQATGGFDTPQQALRSPDGTLLYVVNDPKKNAFVSVLRDRVYPVALGAGTDPWGVSCTPDSGYVIVTGYGGDTVTAVDPARRTAESALPLPKGSAPAGVACSPNGIHTYVAAQGQDDVLVLRRDPRPAVGGARPDPLPGPARGLAFAPNGAHVCVNDASTVYVEAWPLATGAPVGTLLCEGSALYGAAAHPDSTKPRVYVADRNLPGIRVVRMDDPAKPSETTVVVPGSVPTGLGMHPDGGLLYLCDQASATAGVRVLDLTDPDSPKPLPGAGASGLPVATAIAVHPSAGYAYLAYQDPARIGVLALGEDGHVLTLLPGHDVTVPGSVGALAVHPSGGHAHAAVTSPSGAIVTLDPADPARPRLTGQCDSDGATGIAFAPGSDTACLAYGIQLTALALGPPVVDGDPIKLPDQGAEPTGVAVSPDGTRVYVTGQGTDRLYVIDALARTVVYRLNTKKSPTDVAADPSGTAVYLAEHDAASVAVVDLTSHLTTNSATTDTDPRAASLGPDA